MASEAHKFVAHADEPFLAADRNGPSSAASISENRLGAGNPTLNQQPSVAGEDLLRDFIRPYWFVLVSSTSMHWFWLLVAP